MPKVYDLRSCFGGSFFLFYSAAQKKVPCAWQGTLWDVICGCAISGGQQVSCGQQVRGCGHPRRRYR